MDRRRFLRDGSALAATIGAARAVGAASMVPALPPPVAPMLTRPLPSSGVQLPIVGLGTWQTFDPSSKSPEVMARLEATLRALHDAGGRVIDSSPMYGDSERVVGELAERAGLLDSLWMATKVWTSGEARGIRQMQDSAARLRRPTLDLLQVHNLVDWRTHLATLRKWKAEGRVRHIGVTHYQPSAFEELERIVARERIDAVQLPYSVALRDAERRLLPAAREAGVAVIVNLPFGGGGLLRRLSAKPLPESVRAWATSWPQALLKFILANPAVTCVIPGTSDPRHMADNAAAGSGRMPTTAEREALLGEI